MESLRIDNQNKLVDDAQIRYLEEFERITGDCLSEPQFVRLVSLIILWAEEYATLRGMQGAKGIKWGKDTSHYHAAKVDRLDRIAAKAASTTEATENTEDKS